MQFGILDFPFLFAIYYILTKILEGMPRGGKKKISQINSSVEEEEEEVQCSFQ